MSFWKTLLKKNVIDIDNVFNNYDLTKEPSGFIDGENIIVTYDDVARTITLNGDLRCLYHGNLIQEFLANELSEGVYEWTSPAHPEGITSTRFLKYNGNGIEWSTTAWAFYEVQIAYVCYCSSTGVKFAQREVHGLMPWQSHSADHYSVGTVRLSGGELTTNSYTLNSIVTTNKRPNINECKVRDEDLTSTILAFTYGVGAGQNLYSHLFLSEASKVNLENSKTELVNIVTGFPAYNQWDGSAWIQTQLPNARFMSVWVIALPTTADEFSKKFRFMMVQGQSISTSLDAERLQTPLNLNLSGLSGILPEFTFINQIILSRVGNQANDWTIADVVSLRGNRAFFIGQSGGFLTGVTASQVTYTNETSLLSATNVQTAIDELDGITDNKVNSITTGITGADKVTNIVSLTQAEYDALTPNSSTLYVIVG